MLYILYIQGLLENLLKYTLITDYIKHAQRSYLNLSGMFVMLQSTNILLLFLTFFISHLDIFSGNCSNELHPQNIELISVTLPVFHSDISLMKYNYKTYNSYL